MEFPKGRLGLPAAGARPPDARGRPGLDPADKPPAAARGVPGSDHGDHHALLRRRAPRRLLRPQRAGPLVRAHGLVALRRAAPGLRGFCAADLRTLADQQVAMLPVDQVGGRQDKQEYVLPRAIQRTRLHGACHRCSAGRTTLDLGHSSYPNMGLSDARGSAECQPDEAELLHPLHAHKGRSYRSADLWRWCPRDGLRKLLSRQALVPRQGPHGSNWQAAQTNIYIGRSAEHHRDGLRCHGVAGPTQAFSDE
mmetsp:Transcript_93528/g.273876  ORF Transcript_93528/g.273876 Transcript_93528/m.273876 type:complete len:252 (+) Transcript_93528:503-1258(+)